MDDLLHPFFSEAFLHLTQVQEENFHGRWADWRWVFIESQCSGTSLRKCSVSSATKGFALLWSFQKCFSMDHHYLDGKTSFKNHPEVPLPIIFLSWSLSSVAQQKTHFSTRKLHLSLLFFLAVEKLRRGKERGLWFLRVRRILLETS